MAVLNREISEAMRVSATIAIFGSLSLNGVGVVAHVGAIIADKRAPTPLELYQITSSALFFANSALTTQTASVIIKQVG